MKKAIYILLIFNFLLSLFPLYLLFIFPIKYTPEKVKVELISNQTGDTTFAFIPKELYEQGTYTPLVPYEIKDSSPVETISPRVVFDRSIGTWDLYYNPFTKIPFILYILILLLPAPLLFFVKKINTKKNIITLFVFVVFSLLLLLGSDLIWLLATVFAFST